MLGPKLLIGAVALLLLLSALYIVAFLLLAFVLSFLFTWLFNGSGGSLIPVMLFHATQNSEEIFEVLFPSLVGTDWELASSLALLGTGVVVAIVMWRRSRIQHRRPTPRSVG